MGFFLGEIVAGGWDAVDNVINSIGRTTGSIIRPFFPEPQKQEVTNLPIKQAVTAGAPYRPTDPELPSFWETMSMRANQWLESPFEAQFAPQLDTTPIEQMVKTTQPKSPDFIRTLGDIMGGILKGTREAVEIGKEFRTVADEFLDVWGLSGRDPVTGKPRAGYPEGRNEIHWNDLRSWGAAVTGTMQAWGEGIVKQVKGLFNIGFGQEAAQPAFAIKHEVAPSRGLSIGAIAIAAIIVFMLWKRK